ncbi:MAG: hypothetical protein ABIP55_01095 [Tepidisphaeraceae bacterium]
MRKTRHVIAVMVVATALCADRSIAFAPHPARTPARSSLGSRIATSFRQSVAPSMQLRPARTLEIARSFPLPIREAASGVRSEFSTFQFRLPPPAR